MDKVRQTETEKDKRDKDREREYGQIQTARQFDRQTDRERKRQ